MSRLAPIVAALAACLVLAGSASAADPKPPKPRTISKGWEIRSEAAAPALPQPAPPEEGQPDAAHSSAKIKGRASQNGPWTKTKVPGVFDVRAIPALYPGAVKRYRVRFRAPEAVKGFRWLLHFDEVRRRASVYLNGKRIGRNNDAYTPFEVNAKGLKPGKINRLEVLVDNRKDPDLAEGWWNWGGIVRPVRLIPVGGVNLNSPGLLPRVKCRGPARACKASVTLDSVLQRLRGRTIKPEVTIRLTPPGGGKKLKKTFKLPKQRARKRRIKLKMKVPRPVLWSPDRPALYTARITVRNNDLLQQDLKWKMGIRQVTVRDGLLFLNNRRIQVRGASIHEDMPGHGAAMTHGTDQTIVNELKAMGANVTRAHYLLNEDLLRRFDKAGILVWNEAPVWQRDHGANLLKKTKDINRALLTVRRTVKAARNHPSVLVNSVANELTFTPDRHPGTRRFLAKASKIAKDAAPWTPVTVDVKARLNLPRQNTYNKYFDVLGLNQYFGWYPWVPNLSDLPKYFAQMHANYPKLALVNTEFGAEARAAQAGDPATEKGSYAFQSNFVNQTLNYIDTTPYLSGAIHWTLREFEIYPGWTGGAPRLRGQSKNTRHYKGLLTYYGQPKPAWAVARSHFLRTPLYP